MSVRLQGKEFSEMRPYLKMVSWSQSDNNNIRANLKDTRSGKRYHHWLNSFEQEKFELLKNNYKYSDYNKIITV